MREINRKKEIVWGIKKIYLKQPTKEKMRYYKIQGDVNKGIL